jgi:alpha-L-rhamnosidase
VPVGATAEVHVPADDAFDVREGRDPAARADGVELLRMDDGAAVFRVGSGSYEFETR